MATELTRNWTGVSHEYEGQINIELREVVNVMAVRITKAYFRGAIFKGTFEVADVSMPFKLTDGKLKVEVILGWLGARPKETWAHVTILGKYKLIRN